MRHTDRNRMAKSNGSPSPLARWIGHMRDQATRRRTDSVVTDVMRSVDPNRYLDPSVLSRFGLTPMIAKLVVEGFISGLHRSPFHGFSVEFADHREYVPGDDLKFLDWFLFARTDHYYIKRYEDQTNVRCHVLLDRSASMAFGTTGITKWDYACYLTSCLSYLMLKQQDSVGMALLSMRPGVVVPPRSRGSHIRQLMRAMIQNPPAGQTDLASSIRAIIRTLKRRSLVVVISDLIDDPEQTLKALRLIGSHRHDVVVFHIQDPAELELTFEGSTLFKDVETGEEMEINSDAIRDSYRHHIDELMTFYRRRLTEVGIDYEPLDTRQPYEHALWAYLQRRANMRK